MLYHFVFFFALHNKQLIAIPIVLATHEMKEMGIIAYNNNNNNRWYYTTRVFFKEP